MLGNSVEAFPALVPAGLTLICCGMSTGKYPDMDLRVVKTQHEINTRKKYCQTEKCCSVYSVSPSL